MNPMGRALGRSWVSLLLLCCGGCASHPLLDSSNAATGAATAASLTAPAASNAAVVAPVSAYPASSGPTEPESPQPAPVVSLTEAVAVKNSLQKSGYSYAEADVMAKALLSAWEQTAAGTITPPAPTAAEEDIEPEGIPLEPADGRVGSPPPDDRRPGESLASASSRLVEPPRSRFPADPTVTEKGSRSPPARNSEEPADSATESSSQIRPRSRMQVDPDDSRAAAASRDDPSRSEHSHSWLATVREAAVQLRAQLENPDLPTEVRGKYEVMLSLLLVAEEDPEQAVSTLESFDEEELEFWRQTVLGLGTLLDTEGYRRKQDRIERATDHLNQGLHSLSTLGRLQVRNLALCQKVDGYGAFQECQPADIKPNERVLLYVEVENYLAEPLSSGRSSANWLADTKRHSVSATGPTRYATEFEGYYEIFDANQNLVAPLKELPTARDECRNVRRDYYIPYDIRLPRNLPPGAYTLELTITDKKSGKEGNAVLDFQVR